MSQLGTYLADVARQPWQWGVRDCCTFTADWCVRAGYPDPMAFIRGSYATEAEALGLATNPGLLKLATRGYRSIGLQQTKRPETGDVAVIRRPTEDGGNIVCAIRSADRWVTLIERGLIVDEGGKPLRIWRVQWARP